MDHNASKARTFHPHTSGFALYFPRDEAGAVMFDERTGSTHFMRASSTGLHTLLKCDTFSEQDVMNCLAVNVAAASNFVEHLVAIGLCSEID